MLNNIKKYCLGKYCPNILQEKKFLSDAKLKEFTGVNTSKNTGKIGEWYVSYILKYNNIEFVSQPIIKYIDVISNKKRYIQPDFYIPSKDLFIEVKSRTYNCGGTASEKHSHIPQKYSKLQMTKQYANSKILIVFLAGELFIPETLELIHYKKDYSRKYIKDFVNLSKEHNILDWIDINNIDIYIT